ncbi:hypothetical protein WMY93_021181 [Mugilogobius chulae]|uniref:Uncharacterized protein n=1 Tax=Mugilogobius chulae TaxID=88201 RepID=A0AAW0NMC4_9GOBI
MIQPFCCREHHRQDSMSLVPLQCLAVLSSTPQQPQPLQLVHPTASVQVPSICDKSIFRRMLFSLRQHE